ncbi:DUF4136 domain-containing protein [Sphingomonas montana]|uniref:DUF4136 domain-containing protein n=1 Tax=Sphingomonas montana TaxID=1843236 RepID=UPI00096ED964|nr:DUF4136 domain-containing protein [Sphingomonas montana]
MSLRRTILSLAAPLSLLALSACATPFAADVSRYQRMPAPQGQSFVVQALDPDKRGGLEFAQYASYVTQELARQGYRPAATPSAATFVVSLDYGVDNGNEKVVSTPGFGGGFGYGGFGGFGRFGYGRYGFGSPFFYGYGDPFFGGGYNNVQSYTYFTTFLDMQISRTADGERLFEGKAKARSRTDSLPRIVPNLVEAMFTAFPGRSGEEVRITIPEDNRPSTIRDRRR